MLTLLPPTLGTDYGGEHCCTTFLLSACEECDCVLIIYTLPALPLPTPLPTPLRIYLERSTALLLFFLFVLWVRLTRARWHWAAYWSSFAFHFCPPFFR